MPTELMAVIGLLVLAMVVVLAGAVVVVLLDRMRRGFLWRQARRDGDAAAHRRVLTAASRRSHAE